MQRKLNSSKADSCVHFVIILINSWVNTRAENYYRQIIQLSNYTSLQQELQQWSIIFFLFLYSRNLSEVLRLKAISHALKAALHFVRDVGVCCRHKRTENFKRPKGRNKHAVAVAVNAPWEFSRCITRHIYLPCDVSKQHLS